MLNELKQAESELSTDTKSLIIFIKKLQKEAKTRMNHVASTLIELLTQVRFCDSEMPKVKIFESMKINSKNIEIDEVELKLANIYEQDLITYSKRIENWKTEFLETHSGGFECGAVTSDCKTLVIGGRDYSIRVWDAIQKKQICVLHGHDGAVSCITVTGDSKHIISGSTDSTIRIWSINEKAQKAILRGHKIGIEILYYFDHQSLILSGDNLGDIIFWDFDQHTIVKKLENITFTSNLTVMHDNKKFIVGSIDEIIIFETETGSLFTTIEGHKGSVCKLCLASDQNKLVSGSNDGLITIWDLNGFKKLHELKKHASSIWCLALTSDSKFLISGSNNEGVRIWNVQNGSMIKCFNLKSSAYCILNFNEKFLILFQDSTIGELDIRTQEIKIFGFLKHFELFCDASFIAECNLVVYKSMNELVVWDVERDIIKNSIKDNEIYSYEISRNGKFGIFNPKKSKNLIFWDLEGQNKIIELKGHKNSNLCVTLSNDCLRAASSSLDRTVRTWNLKELKQEFKLRGHTSHQSSSIKFIEKKNFLVSAYYNGEVIVWNLNDQTQYALLDYKMIGTIFISDDEQFIILLEDQNVKIWNLNQKQLELEIYGRSTASIWLDDNRIKVGSVKNYFRNKLG